MIEVAAVAPCDLPELCELVNTIIARGGTTAHETPFTPESFTSHVLANRGFVSFFKAVDDDGTALGFQTLCFEDYLPEGYADIGTFTRLGNAKSGVGTALFKATLKVARLSHGKFINATIRADNIGGLAYYTKMGFAKYKTVPAVPLKSGIVVDRIYKRFALGDSSSFLI